MMQNLKKCSWTFNLRIIIPLIMLLFSIGTTAQSKKCSYQDLWLKADYKNLKHAKNEKDRQAKILKTKNLHDTVYAKAYNITGLYHDFSGNADSAITFFKRSLRYLKKYPGRQIPVMINLGTEYNITGDFKNALVWANKALKLSQKHPNGFKQAQVYHLMAASHLYMGDVEKSLSNILKGIKILETRNDHCYLPQLKLTLAGSYLQSNNYRFAADLIEEYLNANKDQKDSKIYAIATVNYTENLIELGQKEKALQLLREIIPYVKQSGDKELEAVLYAKIAYIHDIGGNTQMALEAFERAYILLSEKKSKYSMLIISNYIETLNASKKYDLAILLINEFRKSPAYRKSHLHEKFEYEKAVAAIYEETGNTKEGLIAYKRAMNMCDTLRQWKNGSITEMQAKFQTDFQREKNSMLASHNDDLKKKVETEQRLLVMYLVTMLVVIILILLFLRAYWLKNKLQKEELKSVENEKSFLEQQHELELQLSSSQKQIIDEKHRDATAMALQMANYYDSLYSVIEKLDTGTFSKLTDVKKELQHLIRQKDYWKEFEVRFKNANPYFENKLMDRFPVLTRNDVQFCALLKINLSYKEIASLLQISYESAVTKKYRIKKKMSINDDEEFEKMLTEI